MQAVFLPSIPHRLAYRPAQNFHRFKSNQNGLCAEWLDQRDDLDHVAARDQVGRIGHAGTKNAQVILLHLVSFPADSDCQPLDFFLDPTESEMVDERDG